MENVLTYNLKCYTEVLGYNQQKSFLESVFMAESLSRDESRRKSVGLRGIVGTTRLMAWVVSGGGRGAQSLLR